jgi:hypothetical protein
LGIGIGNPDVAIGCVEEEGVRPRSRHAHKTAYAHRVCFIVTRHKKRGSLPVRGITCVRMCVDALSMVFEIVWRCVINTGFQCTVGATRTTDHRR